MRQSSNLLPGARRAGDLTSVVLMTGQEPTTRERTNCPEVTLGPLVGGRWNGTAKDSKCFREPWPVRRKSGQRSRRGFARMSLAASRFGHLDIPTRRTKVARAGQQHTAGSMA
jgi:hypothetical protein